jgi:serine/threonine protein kinase
MAESLRGESPEKKTNLQGHITAIYGKLTKGQIVHTAFSQYELIKQIGSGGNGRVFSAKDSDGEMFAIKFVDKYQSRIKLKRFQNEINFCEHSSHVNIVKVVDRG